MPDTPYLTLTDIVDVISKSGTPKATCVSQIKNRPEYDPKTDFYKKVRERIVKTHQLGQDKQQFKQVLADLSDSKKASNYPGVVTGYTKWWGAKSFTWFKPPTSKFASSGFEIRVNPELGLVFGGERHIIKLYFKDEKLTLNRVKIVTHLMERCLRPLASSAERMSVLDIRSSKLFTGKGAIPVLDAILTAELAYVAALWPNV